MLKILLLEPLEKFSNVITEGRIVYLVGRTNKSRQRFHNL